MISQVVRVTAAVLFLGINAGAQPIGNDAVSKFMGRNVAITEPERDPDDLFSPKGPASVCLEGPPQRQCYTAPKEFGNGPSVTVVQVEKDMPALLFSAATGGASGLAIHFALLRPGTGRDLQDLFPEDVSVSNQGQHSFWRETPISDAPIFVTADYVWGPGEGHYGEHRYMISAYVHTPSSPFDDGFYFLEDRYMTVHKYDLEGGADVLASERQEILARLRRLKADAEPQNRAPR